MPYIDKAFIPFNLKKHSFITELRLANDTGDSEWSGRLEIYHDNQWGTICDDAFGIDSARVGTNYFNK